MRVAFSWDMTSACNYDCPYCHFSCRNDIARHAADAATVLSAWARIARTYGGATIHVTGGEPFSHPEFPAIVSGLAAGHQLHITTNLSYPVAWLGTLERRDRVRLNATYHPSCVSWAAFMARVNEVRAAGITCGVCYLAYPPHVRELARIRRAFSSEGVMLTVAPFRGSYQGRTYPRDYTADEREIIADPLPAQDAPSRATAPGRCNAGVVYANIDAQGSVTRCGALDRPVFGNLYRGDVLLARSAQPCAQDGRCSEQIYCSPED